MVFWSLTGWDDNDFLLAINDFSMVLWINETKFEFWKMKKGQILPFVILAPVKHLTILESACKGPVCQYMSPQLTPPQLFTSGRVRWSACQARCTGVIMKNCCCHNPPFLSRSNLGYLDTSCIQPMIAAFDQSYQRSGSCFSFVYSEIDSIVNQCGSRVYWHQCRSVVEEIVTSGIHYT